MEMAGKIVYSGSPSDPRTKIARDLVPHDLKVVFVDFILTHIYIIIFGYKRQRININEYLNL